MKKLSLLGMMTLIMGGTLYFLLPVVDKQSDEAHVLRPQVSKAQELFLGSRTQSNSLLSKSLALSSLCDELTTKLNNIDFNLPVEEWVEQLDAESIAECSDPAFSNRLKALTASCLDELNDQECSFNAVLLRSILRTKGIEDSEDRTQLADLVLREFANGTPNFKKLMKFSEKLMDLDPGQLSFHKLWAMSKVIDAMDRKVSPTKFADEIEKRIHPDVWRDEQMMGLDLALKTGFEPANVENVVREMLGERNDSRLHEILGWSLWKQNRRAEALQQLKAAIKTNPKDVWLKEQYQKVSSGKAGLNDYQARFSLGFNFNDLFQ